MSARLDASGRRPMAMHMHSRVEFLAVWDAIASYVENGQEAEAMEELDLLGVAKLRVAEDLLAQFDQTIISVGDA